MFFLLSLQFCKLFAHTGTFDTQATAFLIQSQIVYYELTIVLVAPRFTVASNKHARRDHMDDQRREESGLLQNASISTAVFRDRSCVWKILRKNY